MTAHGEGAPLSRSNDERQDLSDPAARTSSPRRLALAHFRLWRHTRISGKISLMTLIARTTAALRFFGDALEPDVVTALLGKSPTEGRTKGEVIKSETTGRERLARTGYWRFDVEDREPGDLDGQIAQIFSQLTPDISKWHELSKYQPDLFVGFFMDESNEMLALNSASMSLLAERGIHLTFDVYDPRPLSNVQIIDGADNATFSIFQASNEEFAQLFPNGQDMEFAEDFVDRIGEIPAKKIFDAMRERPILKRDADGIHGTIYFNYASKRQAVPTSKREVDFDDRFINEAQRQLFSEWR